MKIKMKPETIARRRAEHKQAMRERHEILKRDLAEKAKSSDDPDFWAELYQEACDRDSEF